jgi:transcriptional regulator with XRE-family HTH domain
LQFSIVVSPSLTLIFQGEKGIFIMGKRTKLVIETPESKTLKKIRLKREISLQKLADKMEVSKSLVHQAESGRADISDEYLKKVLWALDYSFSDFEFLASKRPKEIDSGFRKKCLSIIECLEESKMESLFILLSQF